MVGFIAVFIFLWFFYVLVIKGAIWRLLVGFFGWVGMCAFLLSIFPSSKNTCLTFLSTNFSWAEVLPAIIVMLAVSSDH